MRRRLAAALVVLALIAAACGGGGHRNHLERAVGPSPLVSPVAETTTSTAPVAVAPSTTRATSAPAAPRRPAPTTPRRSSGGGAGGTTAAPDGTTNLAAVRVRLTPVAGISGALAMATRLDDLALYIASKSGGVFAIRGGRVDSVPVLDLNGQVSTGAEQGLLGLAFAPDGDHMYVNYTDTNGDTHVVEYAISNGVANTATRR